MVYASVGRRVVAHILDMLVVAIPMAAIVYIGAREQDVEILLTPVRGALLFLYVFYFHGKTGQTIGKKLMGLMVVDDQGQKIGFLKSARRDSILLFLSLPWIVATVIALQRVPAEAYMRLWGHGEAALEASLRPEWYEQMQVVVLLLVAFDLIVMATNNHRKSIHDYVGGTVVIRTEPATPSPLR